MSIMFNALECADLGVLGKHEN